MKTRQLQIYERRLKVKVLNRLKMRATKYGKMHLAKLRLKEALKGREGSSILHSTGHMREW